MSAGPLPDRLAGQADALRLAFDRGFAEPRGVAAVTTVDLLAIRLGGDPYAVALSEIAGLHVDRTVTPVPGAMAAMCGIAGLRGAVLPVFDLAALVGYPAGPSSRWLLLAASMPVAFAVERFEGHLRVPGAAIVPRDAGEQRHALVPEAVRVDEVVRPIIRLSVVLDRIGRGGE